MSEKNYQALANQYYRLTEETYRKLDPSGTDFMNLGLWPAHSILEAQQKIYRALASHFQSEFDKNPSQSLELLVELGCGWGGGVSELLEILRPAAFIGVNSSANQVQYCQSKFNSTSIQFENRFYETFENPAPNSNSAVVGVESLLHCGDRTAVFEMIQRNQIKYIGLAEILLADEKARSHRLFNPALSFAATFNEYPMLFESFGYELVVEEDVTESVFGPWVNALKNLTPNLTGIHRKIRDQFVESYTALADLGANNQAKYVLYLARKRGL